MVNEWHINELPSLVLIRIFDHLPLVDLVSSPAFVCRRWHQLWRDALSLRKQLILFQARHDLELLRRPKYATDMMDRVSVRASTAEGATTTTRPYCPPISKEAVLRYALMLGDFRSEMVQNWVQKLFARITRLIIVQRNVNVAVLERINSLLNWYGSQLSHVSVFYWYADAELGDDRDEIIDRTQQLFLVVNSLPKLTHLTLNLTLPDLYIEPRLSILSRLRMIRFRSHGLNIQHDEDMMLGSFAEYGTQNRALEEIDFGNPISLGRLLQFDANDLAPKFTRICVDDPLDIDPLVFNAMQLFVSRFHSLNYLTLQIDTIPMRKLSRYLCQLRQLRYLELAFTGKDGVPEEEKRQQQQDDNENGDDEDDDEELAACPSILLLTIVLCTRNHRDTSRLHLAAIFPAVQVVCWSHTSRRCVECGYALPRVGEQEYVREIIDVAERETITECMRLARGPLVRMRSLVGVYMNREPVMPWTRVFKNRDQIV